MKIEYRQIRCDQPGCGRLFEAPFTGKVTFRQLYRDNGWRLRGSMRGPVYYCPRHGKGDKET